jgi:predicted amidohydrolase YtcJ
MAPGVFALCGALLLAGCTAAPLNPGATAELVILGGDVITEDPAQPQASALAVRAGRIAYVGDDAGARRWVGHSTRVLQAGGATVLPGLIDSHIHVMDGALSQRACSFEDQPLAIAQLAPVIRACAARAPGNGWIEVVRLNAAGFHADRHDLDAILADRPLLLWAADGHDAWANSEALRRAGLTRDSVDPANGAIGRDERGEPNGFLVDSAVNLVARLIERPGAALREQALLTTLHGLAADGITTFLEANTSAETVGTYVEIARQGKLHARVSMALQSDGNASDAEFARLRALRDLAATQPLLRADLIKLFADGVMEYPAHTAAMLEPYLEASGQPGTNLGPSYLEAGPLAQFVRRAADEGFGVHVHALGDRATRIALDAFAEARAHGSTRSYSIAHLELVAPGDLPRFLTLNVIASLQLQWARPDNYSVDAMLPYIGPERQARLYPARSLQLAGATIAGGSDWDVSTFNPFEAMAVGISRINPQEPQRGVLGVNETLPLHELFAAYTINAARLLGRDAEIGSLATGKAADLIVLDRHLDDASSSGEVLATKVRYTFMGGAMLIGAARP